MRSPSASSPDALAQLALRDLEQGRIAEAEFKCLRALGAEREHPAALTALGMVLHAQARLDDAIRVFHALTLLQPGKPEHWENLGVTLRAARRYDQALAAYGRALELGAMSASLLYNIGLLNMDRCDYRAAHADLSRAAALAPSDGGVRCALAQCCYEQLRFEEARESLRGWRTFHGLTPDFIAKIAYLLLSMGEVREAEVALKEFPSILASSHGSPTVVRVLERMNRLDEARTALNRLRGAAQFPSPGTDADIVLAEATLAQRDGDHRESARLLSAALEHKDDFRRRHHLLFPLAKSLDALQRHEDAFQALVEAHRSQTAFLDAALGPSGEWPILALTRSGCDAENAASWLAANERAPPPAESPIFVVGFPRSGTTLLEQTLDAHPQLRSMDEQPFLQFALDDALACAIRYPAELGKLTDAQMRSIRAGYWKRVRAKAELAGGQRIVDKNPLNMARLPLIRRLFPHARIILAVRHPCDTLLSCFQQQFRAPDLARACADLGTLAESYRRVFDFWYEQLSLLKPYAHELRYESLVSDFEGEARRLAEFLQLPWDDAMLAPGEHARSKGFISTPSYSQVVQPVNSASVGRWRRYASHFEDVIPVVEPYLARWGYPV
jgi:tetratricopeptide (TPR) repeat protein